ncbi:RNA polymerase sigma factor [Sphingobacterium chuzhouense]|uniref:RNA polymerase sigma-70 factor n=1 Tax=Sphingobacterium chuzhouense TaxID=1742264 RepID=A0ABR7XUL4_9SPHI|nr:RNA polymerase sigma-70 factor [Sphingobacterium chuzhouense]MBD1422745.1 RNA polymerase sigma-70 factor [Sphingobacterium chuzhouense]
MTIDKLYVLNEEKTLLHELQKGDESAFRQIYNQYYGVLYLHAYNKLRDRETAKDIVHDLFAGIWQKRESLTITGKLSSYLYASVRNRILDYISKEQSKANYLESLTQRMESQYEATDHRVREKMLEEQIENVLLQLPPRIREIFELSRKQYLSHKEISQRLNLSEQSVRSYIKDALRALRMKLGSFPWILFLIYCKFL